MKLSVIILATVILIAYYTWKEVKQKRKEQDKWGKK